MCYAVAMVKPFSLYIHIPFCQQRCYYCDFNTLAGQDDKIDVYIKALKQEIDVLTRHFKESIPVHTVYFGGGTPSYIQENHITDLLNMITDRFNLLPGAEITIEANPGTLNDKKLLAYRTCGINRISLGVQTTDNRNLKAIGRIHTFEEVEENIFLARKCGFENISADLIFGLPDMSMQQWNDSLEKMVELCLEHLSLYSLTIEEGTPFGVWFEQGKLHPADEDLVADQYSYAIDWLEQQGYRQYEISNWRRKDDVIDYSSKHNCQYWLNQPYIGIGLGAHSCFHKQRIANTSILNQYIDLIHQMDSGLIKEMPASLFREALTEMDEMKEIIMLGLRLVEKGVSNEDFLVRFGKNITDVFAMEIKELLHHELVQWTEDRLTLTRRGILLGNQVFVHFV
jgi:oxygen-independent coproporphyrinogen-3 oxidase